jgi:hypothetical protein
LKPRDGARIIHARYGLGTVDKTFGDMERIHFDSGYTLRTSGRWPTVEEVRADTKKFEMCASHLPPETA